MAATAAQGYDACVCAARGGMAGRGAIVAAGVATGAAAARARGAAAGAAGAGARAAIDIFLIFLSAMCVEMARGQNAFSSAILETASFPSAILAIYPFVEEQETRLDGFRLFLQPYRYGDLSWRLREVDWLYEFA
ncbi:hypothetical protein EJB05_13175, partial [Eragrostis curvula]